MKYIFIFLLILTASCNKEDNQPPKTLQDWCGYKIAVWGDSFTEGPGVTPIHIKLAVAYLNDSLMYRGGLLYLKNNSAYNGGRSGETSVQIKDRFMYETARHEFSTIIWAGRNNAYDTATVATNTQEMINALPHERFLVFEILNGDFTNEYKGTADYNRITAFNRSQAKKYGDRFVWLKPALQRHAKNTEAVNISNDVVPASLRLDQLHLNDAAYDIIVNECILPKLKKCDPRL